MAKEDFCFTYYDGDALRDMSHMNRLERGAYNDLVLQIRKFGHITVEQIKKCLGKDFETCWESIELVLKRDDEGKFYIDWLDFSIKKMRAHAQHQSDNGKQGGRGKKKKAKRKPKESVGFTEPNPKKPHALPLGDGDGIEDEILIKKECEKFSEEWFVKYFDEALMDGVKSTFRQHNIENEFEIFKLKIRGDPGYKERDVGSIRKAFFYQLKNSTSTNGNRITTQRTPQPTTTVIDQGKSFGLEKGFSRSGTNGRGN